MGLNHLENTLERRLKIEITWRGPGLPIAPTY